MKKMVKSKNSKNNNKSSNNINSKNVSKKTVSKKPIAKIVKKLPKQSSVISNKNKKESTKENKKTMKLNKKVTPSQKLSSGFNNKNNKDNNKDTKKPVAKQIVKLQTFKPQIKSKLIPTIKQKSTPVSKIIKPLVLETEKQYPIMNHHNELMVGTLHEPAKKSDTIVILLHGFLSSRNHNIIKSSAIAFARSGYAAYRVDLSGNGDSEGRFEDSTPNKQIQDAGVVVKHFKEKYSRVYLMGHSLGGSVCLAVAAVGGVDAIITICPPMQKDRIDAILSSEQKDQIASVGFTILKVKKNLVEVPYTLTASFMDEIHSLNPLNLATYIKCSALLIHGSLDTMIPIIDTQDLYEALGSKEKELLMIGGADHNFVNPEYLDALIAGVIDWMNKRK